MKNPVVVMLVAVGAIVLLFAANVIWSWFIWPYISDPILRQQAKSSPDEVIAEYACGSSGYSWKVVRRDYVIMGSKARKALDPSYTGGSPVDSGASGLGTVILPLLEYNGKTITESYVPDLSDALSLQLEYRGAEDISSLDEYRKLADFALNKNGTRKTYVLGAEVMAYQEERSQNRLSYRGVVIPESRMPIADFDVVAKCLNDNLSAVNEQIDTSATADHIGHFNKLGWISYQFESTQPQQVRLEVLD